MDHNHHWYTSQSTPTHPSRQQYQYSQEQQPSGIAADSVQDAQTLLAGYPMASATPTTHVARHLSNMAVTAPPTSFTQSNYYSAQHVSHPQGHPPPYTEYAQELSYLAAPTVPAGDNAYWENARTEAVRLLGDASSHHYSYANHPAAQHWSQSSPSHSAYHPSAFGQSIVQRMYPSSTYSTPPPLVSSSSSLAFALGPPPSTSTQSQAPSQQYAYPQPHQSQAVAPPQSQTYSAPPPPSSASTPQRSYQTPQHSQHPQVQPPSQPHHPPPDHSKDRQAQSTRESVQLPPIRNYHPSREQQSPAVHTPTSNQLPPIRNAASTDQLPPLRFLPPQTPSHNPASHRSTPQRQSSSAQQHTYPGSQPRPTSTPQATHPPYPVSANVVQPTYQHHPQVMQQGPHATYQQSPQPAVSQHPRAQHTAPVQPYVPPPTQHPPSHSHYAAPVPPAHPPAPSSTQPIHHQTNYRFSFHYPHPQSQVHFHHAQQQQVAHAHSYQQSPNGHQYHPHAQYYAQSQHASRTVYRPEESAAFFNEFLENRTREMAMHDPRYRQDAIGHGGVQTSLSKHQPEQAPRLSSTLATVNGYGGEVTAKVGTPVSTPKAAAAKLPNPGATTPMPEIGLGTLSDRGTRTSDGKWTSETPQLLEKEGTTSGASSVSSLVHSQRGEASGVNLSQQATETTANTTPTPPSPSIQSRKRKAFQQMQSASKRRLLEGQDSALTLSQSSSLTSLSSSLMRSVATEAQAANTNLNRSTLTPPSSQASLTASDVGSDLASGSGSGLESSSIKSVSSGSRISMSEGRLVNKAYVAVPYKPWLTNSSHSSSRKDSAHRRQHKNFGGQRAGQNKIGRPKRARDAVDDGEAMEIHRMAYEDDLDDADYDDSQGYDGSPTKKSQARLAFVTPSRAEPVSGSIALGADHGPLSKFTLLLEDIFEAEDTLPAELSTADLEDSEFFSSLTTDGTPLLNPNVIKKLTKLIEQIARPTKRMKQAAAAGNRILSGGGVADSIGKPRSTMSTPKFLSIGRMSDVDAAMIGRILKLLDRSVRLGEDVDPFATPNVRASRTVDSIMGDENGSVPGGNTLVLPKSPKKRRAAKARKGDAGAKSKAAQADGEENEDGKSEINGDDEKASQHSSGDVQDSDLNGLTKTLDASRDSLLAADCVIALLGSDRLTKQLYSEELITICLTAIKDQLTKLIYPFIENSTPDSLAYSPFNNSVLLRYLILAKGPSHSGGGHGIDPGSAVENHRKQLAEIFQILSGVIFKITKLVDAESVAMSDSIIIQSVFIAIGPFFVVEPAESGDSAGGGIGEGKVGGAEKERKRKDGSAGNVVVKTFGKSAMRGLRLEALSLIRIIFANHESQRSWIIEEILTSLIKLSDTKQKAGQFKLRDGRSIKTVSALLLQLVQTSAHDIRIEARKIHKARQDKFVLKRQESIVESQNRKTSEPFLDDSDHEEIRLYSTGLESATKAAKTIILFLTQRSGKGKLTKNSNEAEYRTIFDNLMSDLLVVHNWPEWPAANLLLSIASKFMVSSLDDVKSTSQADNNAARTMALDHLGVVAAHMRASTLKVQQQGVEGGFRGLKPLDELVAAGDIKSLEKLLSGYRDLATHLCRRSAEDQAYDSARELTAVTFGQELASALRSTNMKIDGEDDDIASAIKDPLKLLALGKKLKASLRDIWKDPGVDVFDSLQDDLGSVDRLAEEIGIIQSMRSSFQPILGVILMALDAPPIFMRTKALRALGQIVTSDAAILSTPNVRRAIESHLLDSSPAVRDAAVELIGKYMIDAPEVAGNYYQKIADRIADTGLAVRKRVIKLLKSYYSVTDSTSHRIDVSTRMVLRMLDEDDTVKELAIKTLEELWFPNMTLGSGTVSGRQRGGVPQPGAQSEDNIGLQGKVAVIMGTAANFKDRQSPLEEMLRKIISEKSEAEVAALHARYEEICETLIDGLVDASDLPGFTVINCIRTIYLFTSAYPSILSGSRASTLLPYLKNATTPEEQTTSDYLLKIFKASIPHMPKTAAKFGQELQSALQPMIIKPSGGNLHVLQETVACLCAVVQGLTHDFSRLINLVKSCNVRLQEAIVKKPTLGPNEIRPLSILIFILSLLGQHCNFDKLRADYDTPGLTAEINLISQGPIIEHLYDSLLKLYNKFDIPSLRGRILQCLGFLFRAQPTLMTEERSATIMDNIFTSPEEEGHGRVLKIIQEFLISEADKHANKEKDNAKVKGKPVEAQVNMEELVGNTEGFADSGVSSAVVQRYINPIIASALSQNVQIQAAAIDILTFTVKQGLTHPLQSFPVIVALETSPSPTLSNRASALHTILHAKHSSLLNARFAASARASFDYQKKITSGPVQGFRVQASMPIAMLQRWYSLVREKRPARQDFLKAMVKVFEENPGHQSSQDDVDFTRYMAENFSAFEYKTQEEVLTVIKHLTRILSTTGMQVLEVVSPSHLLAQLHSTNANAAAQPNITGDEMAVDNTNQQPQACELDKIPLMRTSVIIAMVMLLKSHLKALYSLSEEKCNKFVIGKKSAIGDRPATKRHENPISWDRLPYGTAPILTSEDVALQKARFLEIWNEDGVSAEPEDDLA